MKGGKKMARAICLLGGLLLAPLCLLRADLAAEDEVFELTKAAALLRNRGKVREALQVQQKAYDLAKKRLAPDHPGLLVSMGNLAILLGDTGQYARAEPLARARFEGIQRLVKSKGGSEDHPAVIDGRSDLAELNRLLRRFALAEKLHRENLEALKKREPPDWFARARCHNNLGVLYDDMGQSKQAEEHLRAGLAIVKDSRKVRRVPEQIARNCNNLGHHYLLRKQYDLAEKLLLEALDVRERELRGRSPGLPAVWQNLALVYRGKKEHRKAISFYEKLLAHREKADNPLAVAETLVNLATLHDVLGQDGEAGPLYRKAHKAYEQRSVPQDPRRIRATTTLARYLASRGKEKEAWPLLDQARRGTTEYVADLLPYQSGPEMKKYLGTTYRGDLYGPLTLAWQERADARKVAESAAWLVNGKAQFMEGLREINLLARDLADGELKGQGLELVKLRMGRAPLALSPPRAVSEKEWKKELTRLGDKEQGLVKQLQKTGKVPLRLRSWIDLDEVRRNLPEGAVLIDVARFTLHDFKARPGPAAWKPARYAAWVTPRRGDVRLIDLGPAEPIDLAVRAFQKAMASAPKALGFETEADAEAILRKPLARLSELVLKPLLPAIGKEKHWLISPDASLWLVPWGALPLPDRAYALERYQISYLTTARDLVADRSREAKGPALVVGAPDFDLKVAAPGAPRAQPWHPLLRGSEGLPWDRLTRWEHLREAGDEIEAIAPRLKTYAKGAPKVYTGAKARKSVCVEARQPRVLVLVTHGYFVDEEQAESWPGAFGGAEEAPARKASVPGLFRCGLVFAGANQRREEGLLTGREIIEIDLRGTRLVVLSACETGRGVVLEVDGVTALRQCFHLAGAQSVVATLWKIPDAASAELMKAFWDNLARGQGRAEALRQAQLGTIKARREQLKKAGKAPAAHPYYWAAFTLTGDWR